MRAARWGEAHGRQSQLRLACGSCLELHRSALAYLLSSRSFRHAHGPETLTRVCVSVMTEEMETTRVRTRRWSRSEYEWLIDQGVFREDERLELLAGALVVKEPQG